MICGLVKCRIRSASSASPCDVGSMISGFAAFMAAKHSQFCAMRQRRFSHPAYNEAVVLTQGALVAAGLRWWLPLKYGNHTAFRRFWGRGARMKTTSVGVLSLLLASAAFSPVQAQSLLDRLESRLKGDSTEVPNPPPDPAETRVSLGVLVAPLLDAAGQPIDNGAVIESIVPNSPAARAGLPLGGIIIAIDGTRVGTPDDLATVIAAARPAQEVELTYYQGDLLYRKKVRLSPLAAVERPVLPVDPGVLEEPMPGERPLDRLEKVLDGDLPLPPPPNEELEQLRRQVELLERQIELLTERVRALEARD